MAHRLTPVARRLRREMTPQEHALWAVLRDRRLEDIKFRKQMRLSNYIADFASVEMRMVIELDGGHHADQVAKDAARTEMIEAFGYRVVRFWNNDVDGNLSGVVDVLREEIRIARGL